MEFSGLPTKLLLALALVFFPRVQPVVRNPALPAILDPNLYREVFFAVITNLWWGSSPDFPTLVLVFH